MTSARRLVFPSNYFKINKLLVTVATVLGAVATLYARENVGIPADVYYLMPKMDRMIK